ncbi:Re/Si-specific NAD(P)(+) transhydrogenase subunit alpha [Kordiimonas sp.]|uniref:Re/Si-specific NAD(P)(+) transhydrogenase subunit alpha n=1 Tax=Kordiimonas sp. TaxID=1970157 RepID=UPI003A94B8EB
MKLAVLRERRDAEKRVAATPETVKKLIALGFAVSVEKGAGDAASVPDSLYTDAGATTGKDLKATLKDADVIFSVQGLEGADAKLAKKGAAQLSVLNPFTEGERLQAYADAGLMAFAMEFVPRITRAQSMDVLSSQSNLAGYKAVLDATAEYGRALPMMMTAAGTIAPARVMVMGAGVAGLQAIATAKRLGAIVSATDVRAAAKEQVESLGGKFVMVEDEETAAAETSGGYAKEMSDDYKTKQAALIAETLAKQDIAITTALIPGRPAPKLITEDMIKSMKPGSVIVDLAVEAGGNCALSEPGKVVEAHGVKIVGHKNVPSRLAADASALFARNLVHFITPMVKEGALAFDFEDQIIKESLITKDGAIVNERLVGEK